MDKEMQPAIPLTMRQAAKFPVNWRPEVREISSAVQEDIDVWFQQSDITIGEVADTPAKQAQVR